MPQVVQLVEEQYLQLIVNNAQMLVVIERLDKLVYWSVATATCLTFIVLWQFWGRLRARDAA